MKLSIQLILASMLLTGGLAAAGSTHAQTPQNILLIIADDLGTEKLSIYKNDIQHSNTVASTPNIQDLADQGVRFTQAWSNPACSPTRAGILLGRHAFRHGIGGVVSHSSGIFLDPSETTLADIITTHGGNAALLGKWHLGTATTQGDDDAPRIAGGFDEYAGGLGGRVSRYDQWQKVENGSGMTTTTYATFDTAQETIDWVSTQTTPWLAVVAFNAPHTPLHDPPGYNNGVTCKASSRSDDDLLCFRSMVEYMDGQIGRLRTELTAAGKMNDTTIIFTGDNGGIRALAEKPFTAQKVKGTVYEGGVNVPLIISGSGVTDPGRAVTDPVQTLDLFATILELMGFSTELSALRLSATIDSVDLTPYLDQTATHPLHSRVYTEGFALSPLDSSAAIRDAQYKLIRTFRGGSVSAEEFYDLTAARPGRHREAKDLLTGPLTADQQAARDSLAAAMDALRATEGY